MLSMSYVLENIRGSFEVRSLGLQSSHVHRLDLSTWWLSDLLVLLALANNNTLVADLREGMTEIFLHFSYSSHV